MSRPNFHVATTSLFRLCCNTVLYYLHLCRDRGLFPLSLTSCCSFVMMLRHDFLVLSIFAVATQFSCHNKITLCLAYSLCRNKITLCLAYSLCRDKITLCLAYSFCHDRTSLHCVESSVTTQFVMSRRNFFEFMLKPLS